MARHGESLSHEEDPRLWAALQALGASDSIDTHVDADMRWSSYLELDRAAEEARSGFDLEDFLGGAETSSRARECYKDFMALVAEVCSESIERHQARTMYNVLSQDKDKKERIEVAVSHFSLRGTLFKRELDKLHSLAQELKNIKLNRSAPTGAGAPTREDFSHFLEREGLEYKTPAVDFSFDDVSAKEEKEQHMGAPPLVGKENGDDGGDTEGAWLLALVERHLSSSTGRLAFESSSDFAVKLQGVCSQHGNNPDILQGSLFELVGDSGFELMLEVMEHAGRIAAIPVGSLTDAAAVPVPSTLTGTGTVAAGATFPPLPDQTEINIENMSANQRRKHEAKMKKMEEATLALEQAQLREMERGGKVDWLRAVGFDQEYLEQERGLGLEKYKQQVVGESKWVEDLKDTYGIHGLGLDHSREKKGLGAGAERRTGPGFEEVNIPAPKKRVLREEADLIEVATLRPSWAQLAFEGMKRLNTIQSEVYHTAYNENQNMLICAPTGAGKTNIAMLAFLQLLKQHLPGDDPSEALDGQAGDQAKDGSEEEYRDDEGDNGWYDDSEVDYAAIKAVYIAPMKALAQEVVVKFGERVQKLGITVRECTGDMQLTRNEIMDSQLLVVTPEKYDVITRKGGDGTLMTMVGLVIIDEVHLLADDRGAVIETIVARTQRYIESSQRNVRIVGLSATLPNYRDVARFLGVVDSGNKPGGGLYHFGPEYRPVPLDTTFIGVTEKSRVKAKEQMNMHAYRKMVAALEKGKQVMVFVHSRKDTMSTAEFCKTQASKEGTAGLLDCHEMDGYSAWAKEVGSLEKDGEKSGNGRGGELAELFPHGMGIHHAGLHRRDRGLTERMFEAGAIKVLFCTATLAWGVNLPGHTVIIKGTELYDPERGGFVDVGILDILQIFGRAGRPQYDTTGHAVLITQHKSLNMYLALIGHQAPIESSFIKSLPDHMNAEIVNGTISNMHEASQWLSYTFLFIRMRANPLVYGMNHDELYDDPQLDKKRRKLVEDAADTLDMAMMARYDARSGNLGTTDLGRIASHYYIKHGSIAAFNTMLSAHLSHAEALHVVCSSAEFDNLKVRPEELGELEALKRTVGMHKGAHAVKLSADETAGKVGVLLTSYCKHERIQAFTLQSDSNYIAQNAGRITRALFEVCLKRGWSSLARHYLELSKGIEKRVGAEASPLRQFEVLPHQVVNKVEEKGLTPERIITMSGGEIGRLIREQKWGSKVLALAYNLPYLSIEHRVQPITRAILRITLHIIPDFQWNNHYHGLMECWHLWVEDGEHERVYQSETLNYGRKQYDAREEVVMEFTIPIQDPPPPQYFVRAVSDRWVDVETCVAISFQHLLLPDRMTAHTPLLDVHPVPVNALQNAAYERLYSSKGISHFNPIQSQVFHTLYHSDKNVLLGAPTGSGKTIVAELALLRMKAEFPTAICVYVAPLKALARERVSDWRAKLGKSKNEGGLGLYVVELTGESTPNYGVLNKADILIVTPEKWDVISRGWRGRQYVQRVKLLVLDEVHLLGVERGAVLEVIVSRMRLMSQQRGLLASRSKEKNEGGAHEVRLVGLSTALANARDLADWLGIGQIGVYNFQPSVRPVPMSIYIQGFPGKHYCPRMASMNKPCYAAICEHSPTKPTLIFVSSRRQTRLTALDLISYCAADDDPHRFRHMNEEETEIVTLGFKDSALKSTIAFGVGIHHAGLDEKDRVTTERLFLENKIGVLVATSTLAWGVNLPCHLVIVKGTEFFDGKTSRYQDFPVTDVLQMMGRAGRPQFDDHAVAVIMTHEPKKNFYKKFLHSPFPVESSLHGNLHIHVSAEVNTGTLSSLSDCVEWLSWTYFFRRLAYNPSYYGLVDHSNQGTRVFVIKLLVGVLVDLEAYGALRLESGEASTPSTVLKREGTEAPPFSTIVCALTQAQQSRRLKEGEAKTTAHTTRTAALTALALGVPGSSLTVEGGSNEHAEIASMSVEQGLDFLVLPTEKGCIASEYYLQYSTADLFEKRVLELVSIPSLQNVSTEAVQEKLVYLLLLILCESPEYAQLPVRHNEDLLNMQLAQSIPTAELPHLPVGTAGEDMPIGVAPQALDSPHAKSFLLLLAHMYRLALPITDYVNDTKSVLEQFPRLVGSLMEVIVHLAAPTKEGKVSKWPDAAVSSSSLLAALATLSAMSACGEPYKPVSERAAGRVTVDKATHATGEQVKLALSVSLASATRQTRTPKLGSRKNQADVSLWIFVTQTDTSSSREAILAAKKLEISDKHAGQRTVDVKIQSTSTEGCSVCLLDTNRQSLPVTARVIGATEGCSK